MAEILWVHEGYKAEFERAINSYSTKINDISSKYDKAKSYYSSYCGDSDVNSCNVYLKKRKQAFEEAKKNVTTIKNRANNYVSSVISADNVIKNSIHKMSYDFYKAKGIGPKSDSAWDRFKYSVKTTASDFLHSIGKAADRIVEAVKDFYEKFKYIINVVFDVVAVVAAVALCAVITAVTGPLGVICLIGGIWAVSKASFELITDMMAVDAWINGDIARAEELSNMTLTESIVNVGAWLDDVTGKNFFEAIAKGLTIGLDLCQLVLEVVVIGEAVKKIFNLQDLKQLDFFNATGRSWRQSLHYADMTDWFRADRFGSMLNWGKFALHMAGFSIKIDATSSNQLIQSLLKNYKNNKSVLQNILNGIIKNPFSKIINQHRDNISSIISI